MATSSQGRRYRVLGALGMAASSPLLAEVFDGEDLVDRVVLGHPGPPSVQAALRLVASPALVAEQGVVETSVGRFGAVPWVPGLDLISLQELHPQGLPGDLCLALVHAVARALLRAQGSGIHHGRLGASCVRVGDDGIVRVLGFTGAGDDPADVASLRDLLEELAGLHDGRDPDRTVAAVLADWPACLAPLVAHLAPHVRGFDLAEAVAPWVLAAPEPVHDHALAGQVLTSKNSATAAPPKVRVAVYSGITLVLGVAAGWFLASAPPSGAEVQVDGAERVVVVCDNTSGSTIRLGAGSCTVTATLGDGTQVRGTLDGSAAGRYQCLADDGGLQCIAR